MSVESIAIQTIAQQALSCSSCQASCCRLEVMLVTDTGVPDQYISSDAWGAQVMHQLDDGWCSALNRDTFLCNIYENRPLICREFAMGEFECQTEYQVNS
ncbi:MAG: hypothetical protein ISEC1_P0292 [Thiomicrorhabdus sp.]|nr:MAG: hypothetical protein ISEC1_P0292 [Thiomicrorhabdus sp.]